MGRIRSRRHTRWLRIREREEYCESNTVLLGVIRFWSSELKHRSRGNMARVTALMLTLHELVSLCNPLYWNFSAPRSTLSQCTPQSLSLFITPLVAWMVYPVFWGKFCSVDSYHQIPSNFWLWHFHDIDCIYYCISKKSWGWAGCDQTAPYTAHILLSNFVCIFICF